MTPPAVSALATGLMVWTAGNLFRGLLRPRTRATPSRRQGSAGLENRTLSNSSARHIQAASRHNLIRAAVAALSNYARLRYSQHASRLALMLLVSMALASINPKIGLGMFVVSMTLAEARRVRYQRQLLERRFGALPEALIIMKMGVGAGYNITQAIGLAARNTPEPLGPVFSEVYQNLQLGARLDDAVGALVKALPVEARPVTASLVSAERHGTNLTGRLDRQAHEIQQKIRHRAEQRARKAPVQMLLPLVTCTLPAFGVLTVVPMLVSAFSSLDLPS